MTDTQENVEPEQVADTKKAKKKLILAVLFFSVAGVVILVFQILPAQFGIDLTGYGTYIGLIKVYESKQELEQLKNTTEKQEQVEIEIDPGEELEYKIFILADDPLEYSWKTDNGEIYAEFHGELLAGSGALLETFKKSTASEDSGEFSAPFEGTHGWYWRNDNDFAVKVTLDTKGKYNTVGRKAAAFSRK